MKILFPFALMLAMLPAHAQLYKWSDANGHVHYSNQPQEGVKTTELQVPQAQPVPTAAQDDWRERDRISRENWRRQTETDNRMAAAQATAEARQRTVIIAGNRTADNPNSEELLFYRRLRQRDFAKRAGTATVAPARAARPASRPSGARK